MSQSFTIARLGHHGDGIADGPIFVPRTLPGEVVEGELDGNRVPAPRITMPSSDRVRPPCPHYRTCGGCAVQHASDEFVAQWKLGIVQAALDAHGLDAPLAPIHTSPPRTRRRAAFSGRRTKKGAMIGFHARASDVLVEIPECHLLRPELLACRPALEALVIAGGSRKGEMTLTVTMTDNGPDVSVSGGKALDGQSRVPLAQLTDQFGLARLSWNGDLVAQETPPKVRFDGIAASPPPGAFLQATQDGEEALRSVVTDAVRNAGRIADLFSGCGTFSLPLARFASVHAVEGEREMIASLEQGWRQATGLKAVSTEVRDLFRRPLMEDELRSFDAVVLDPPRAGAEAQVTEIAKSAVPRVAYVSCNPTTFARDAAHLGEAGFTLQNVHVVDQFRWSTHVELAAVLTR